MNKKDYENWWPIHWRKMVSFNPTDKVRFLWRDRPVPQVRTIADWGLSSFFALLVMLPFAVAYFPDLALVFLYALAAGYLLTAVVAIATMRKRYPVPENSGTPEDKEPVSSGEKQ